MAAVTGSAPGAPALMLFVTVTVQVMSGGAASLPEPLHWVMSVTRSDELVVNEPFPGGHGSREHCRTTVTVEDVAPVLETVLTTVMSQVMPVVAPMGPPLRLLHWPSATLAALAGDVVDARPATENPATSRSASAHDAQRGTGGRPDIGVVRVVTRQAFREAVSSPIGQPGTNGIE